MLAFLLVFSLIMIMAHGFIGVSLSLLFDLSVPANRLLLIALGAMLLLSLLGFPVTRLLPFEKTRLFAAVFYIWLGVLFLLFVAVTLADTALILAQHAAPEALADPVRRAFFKKLLGVAALGASGALSILAHENYRKAATIKSLDVKINRLPTSFEGLRIAQLTDLHMGETRGSAWLKDVVEQTNALQPDLIAITGDLVDGSVMDLGPEVAALADLRAPLGVYFVTGNHEYYSGVGPWCAYLESLGIRVLHNERVSLTRGAAQETLDLAGIDDYASTYATGQRPDVSKALEGRDNNAPVILLAHQPRAVFDAAKHNVDLVLSGHTHGGQIWPFGFLTHLQQPYIKGLHRHLESPTQIYVSSGTGCWGPPMRLGTENEIAVITLRGKA